MASKLAMTLGVAVGSAVLAGLPPGSQATPVTDIENNNSFPGQSVDTTVTPDPVITGSVDFTDRVDFFNLSGLTPGSFFDVFVELTTNNGPLFTDVSDTGLNQLDFDNLNGNGSSVHLNGTVPANGQIVVQISNQSNTVCCFEGYRISLTQKVPLAPSLALVAAGLVGLGGLHVARRKKAA